MCTLDGLEPINVTEEDIKHTLTYEVLFCLNVDAKGINMKPCVRASWGNGPAGKSQCVLSVDGMIDLHDSPFAKPPCVQF